jgi:glutaredoxin
MHYTSDKTAIVYSQVNCPGCVEAKKLLQDRGYAVEVRTLGEGGNVTKQQLLRDFPDARSVPQIIINNNKVGNLSTLKTFLKAQ